MEHQTNTAAPAIASGAWAQFEQEIARCSTIKECVDVITIFLHGNYDHAKAVLNFIDRHENATLFCGEFHDNELAVHVFKEALIKQYRGISSTATLPMHFTRLVNEIKNCYLFSLQNLRTLNELLPN